MKKVDRIIVKIRKNMPVLEKEYGVKLDNQLNPAVDLVRGCRITLKNNKEPFFCQNEPT